MPSSGKTTTRNVAFIGPLTLDAPLRNFRRLRAADTAPAAPGARARAALRLVSSSAGPANAPAARNETADESWQRAPRGIGLGVLLAIPFWIAIGVLQAWLL